MDFDEWYGGMEFKWGGSRIPLDWVREAWAACRQYADADHEAELAALRAEVASAHAAQRHAEKELSQYMAWYAMAEHQHLHEQRRAEKAEAERDALKTTLLVCARQAEALKRDCGMDPESPQAIRNAQYQNISTTAHIALGTIRGPRAALRLTPNKIANLVMADEAWHDSEYVAASDYDALSAELAALRAEVELWKERAYQLSHA